MSHWTEERVQRLWKWYARRRSPRIREWLIVHYASLAEGHAQRLSARLPEVVDVEDLAGSGMFGLIDAVETYNPYQGARFETYAAMKIRGSMLDELRALDWVPRLVRRRSKDLAEVVWRFRAEQGRNPSGEEAAARLGVPEEKMNRVLRDGTPHLLVSLSQEQPAGGGGEMGDLGSTLADRRSPDPARISEREAVKDWLLQGFDRQDRLVVTLYYFEQMTMREIADVLGVCEARVCQRHKAILERLRARLSGWQAGRKLPSTAISVIA